jgi:cyclopropane fatty-acyl-phospholipid synthase-like methyltransferase
MLYGAGLEGASEQFGVLDIGCGNRAQTLRLALELGCKVTAVDNHQPYLDELGRRAEAQNLAGYEAPSDDDETQAFAGMIRSEIDVYRRFSCWFG